MHGDVPAWRAAVARRLAVEELAAAGKHVRVAHDRLGQWQRGRVECARGGDGAAKRRAVPTPAAGHCKQASTCALSEV